MKRNNHIHFIGIGGTAMAALAVAFKRAGFKITGSDANTIFPPMSEYLKKNKIKYHIGFNKNNVGEPNEIVVGNAHYSEKNPEVVYAKENKIELEHFPRLVEKYLIKKNSVVVAGTYGKTTITSMTAWLLDKANKKPNYLIGGIPLNFNHGARLTFHPASKEQGRGWSVVEGDEYPSASPWDFSPKFKYYHPKYLILTSAEWDHMDIYKTKQSYLNVFKDLVKSVPRNGLIVAKLDGENLDEVLKKAKCKVVFYQYHPDDCDKYQGKKGLAGLINKKAVKNKNTILYSVMPEQEDSSLLQFTMFITTFQDGICKKIAKFKTQLIGEFNLENWAAVLALAYELKIPEKTILDAVKSFKGVKRRLEIRARLPKKGSMNKASLNGVTIIDDFAHSPSKAKQSVKALLRHFPKSRIFVIFEPNRGGRSIKCLKKYNHVFNGVHKVFIPKLTEYKKKKGVRDVTGQELADHLKLTHCLDGGVVYQPDNRKIIAFLFKNTKPGDVIAFLGSRDFKGMIKELCNS